MCTGGCQSPQVFRRFQSACLQIKDEHEDFVWPSTISNSLECFTDGACLAPTSPIGKLAAWGVILGDPVTQHFHPLSAGLVPGWTQTSLRGEMWAAISGMKFAMLVGRPIRIWCDNDLVVLCYQKMTCKIKPNSSNADLWQLVYQLVRKL